MATRHISLGLFFFTYLLLGGENVLQDAPFESSQ